MAGKSNKEMNSVFQSLMEARGWNNLTEMSKSTGINLMTLRQYAYDNRTPAAWVSALSLAEAFQVNAEDLMKDLLSAKVS